MGQEGIDHDRRGIARQFQAQPVMETGLGKHNHGVRQVLEKPAGADLKGGPLTGLAALRAMDNGRGLGRNMGHGVGLAGDRDVEFVAGVQAAGARLQV